MGVYYENGEEPVWGSLGEMVYMASAYFLLYLLISIHPPPHGGYIPLSVLTAFMSSRLD